MSKGFLSNTTQNLEENLDEVNREMQEHEAIAKAHLLALPYVDLHRFPVDLSVLAMFSEEEALEMGAVVFFKDKSDLKIGTTNPTHPLFLEKVKELVRRYKVAIYFISQRSLSQTLRFYSKVIKPKISDDATIRIESNIDFEARAKAFAQNSVSFTGTQILEFIFGYAVLEGASDIHLEPEEHYVNLRFRVDGVLHSVVKFSKTLQNSIITRIKILAALKLNVTNLAQDGRITFFNHGQAVDVRVSVLPSSFGEEIVMRLLNSASIQIALVDLGFNEKQMQILERVIKRPNGMVINTGPTGSGKTTSLYAFLNELNEPGVKIITLEDPVEYKLEGIVQTPIDHNVDFNFAKGLRAILRQDPDIVMVGEIRDQETAETAMQAALTGHLVFSTLHTNDAAGAIPRLLNMGVKPFVVAPALSLVIAQRLLRKICQNCKEAVSLSPTVLEKINFILKSISPTAAVTLPRTLQFYHSVGCLKCNQLGYKGRLGVYELLENTEAIQKLILKENTPMAEFKKVAIEQGMVTMVQDGLLKALAGLTDVEEVFRVVGE